MKSEIAEIITNTGVLYFRFDPSAYDELEREIAMVVEPNSVVLVEVYSVH